MTSSRPFSADPSSDAPASAISRRRFLSLIARLAAYGVAGELLLPRLRAAATAGGVQPAASIGWLDLGPSSSLTDGSPAAFPYGGPAQDGDGRNARTGVIFVTAIDERSFQALSNICPHQGCRVHWDAAQHVFACPCHHASFAPDGQVLAGPPQAPLAQFSARVRDGHVQIKINA